MMITAAEIINFEIFQLTIQSHSDTIYLAFGGIAQLGEQVTSKATRNRNAASKKLISRKSSKIKGFRFHGGIAQLGERLNGIQEVSGSIPLISTLAELYEHATAKSALI